MGGHNVDAFVAIGGCDKNMPGSMIAIANMDIPAIFAYGGTLSLIHIFFWLLEILRMKILLMAVIRQK